MKNVNVDEIKSRIEDNVAVSVKEIKKENGVVRTAVIIKEEGNPISPVIYVDDMPDDKLVDIVVETYNRFKINDDSTTQKICDSLLSKEYVVENVFPCLINREKNEELISNLVHTSLFDLEIIYRVPVDLGGVAGKGAVAVENSLLEKIEMSFEELHQTALNNIKGKTVIRKMENVIPIPLGEETGMLVAENGKHYGARAIIEDDFVEKIYEFLGFETDLYIIPSSISEVIVIPVNEENDYEEDVKMLKDLICFVNSNELPDDMFLSNSLYVVRKDTRKMEVA